MIPGLGLIAGKIGVKGIIFGLAALAVGAIIVLGYRHYAGLVEDLAVSRANEAKLRTALEVERAAVDQLTRVAEEWRESSERYQRRVAEAQREADAAREEARRLNDIFARHDLGALAAAKPGLIERRVDRAAARSRELLECLTAPGRGDCGGDGGAEAGGEAPDP